MARLAFLGTPEPAATSLRALIGAGHDVVLVVTRPDKRRGRGALAAPSPVKQVALEAGLTVTERVDDVVGCGAELGVVVAYGRIVPASVLARLSMVNAHFSLLPRWRGAAPVERAILAGDRYTGVSIMRLEEGLDTGPVLAARPEQIHHSQREHAAALTRRLAEVAAEMLVELLSEGAAALGPGTAQAGEATYAAKLEPQELMLDFSRNVLELERTVRLDRSWTTFRDERLRVLDAVARDGRAPESSGAPARYSTAAPVASPARSHAAVPVTGALLGTAVQASDGMLELLEVQPAGRRAQSAADWIRGARPEPGERLGE
ncbi:MAG TPA: methionyl-tRNA formyltransferase [Acidimicrobiales bacterium]|nr:methionyl-tRNA formyltransferase [Acidimicrobiales bacterium]